MLGNSTLFRVGTSCVPAVEEIAPTGHVGLAPLAGARCRLLTSYRWRDIGVPRAETPPWFVHGWLVPTVVRVHVFVPLIRPTCFQFFMPD
jgi:hypothetical protein